MMCHHDRGDLSLTLSIERAGGTASELYQCQDCGAFLELRPVDVAAYLREHGASGAGIDVCDGGALILSALDPDDIAPPHAGMSL